MVMADNTAHSSWIVFIGVFSVGKSEASKQRCLGFTYLILKIACIFKRLCDGTTANLHLLKAAVYKSICLPRF